jgi:hypothetical protein
VTTAVTAPLVESVEPTMTNEYGQPITISQNIERKTGKSVRALQRLPINIGAQAATLSNLS